MKQRSYQKLIAWKEAHSLCLWTYKVTELLPKKEQYRLIDQMCRAASSVPTNIAEGCEKKSGKERWRFYETAMCSLEELHYHFLLAHDLRYIDEEKFNDANDRISRTSFLIHKLRSACKS